MARKSAQQAKGEDAGPLQTVRVLSKTTLRDLFGIDWRSLATFRIAISALLLIDLAIRARDLRTMYTDDGMFPRAEICRHLTTIWNWSFHFGSGLWGYQAALFGLAAALAIALLVGFETRLAAVGSWLMLVSLHHRVPPILSGADVLLRMLLFWAMFLPLERVWSIDARLQKHRGGLAIENNQKTALSVASAAILLQMALMYLFSAIFKTNFGWLKGSAVAGILSHDFYASPLAEKLLQFPLLLSGMTWGTFTLEWIAPLLLFSPRWTPSLRLGLVAALAAMHLGIGILLEVDIFSYVSVAGLILFLPATFWDGLLARFWRPSNAVGHLSNLQSRITKPPARSPYVTQAISLLMLIFVILTNIGTLPGFSGLQDSLGGFNFLTRGCGLGQKWNMFEEIPSRSGWYVAFGKLKDGSEIDLLRHGAAVDWNKPRFPAGIYPNYRWRKCFREMAYTDQLGYQVYRVPVAEFLCRDWNARNPSEKQVTEFDFIYCAESRGKALGSSNTQVLFRERLLHLDLSGSEDGRPIVRL